MDDGARDEDRLPWLDSPRASRLTPAARRARAPLFALLGLFFAGAIAVMAFLVGRSTVPDRPPLAVVRPVPSPARVPPPVPAPAPPVVALAPVSATPAPRIAEAPRVIPARPRATPAKVRKKATPRRAAAAPATRAPRLAQRPAARPNRVASATIAPRRRAPWPARPFAGPRGRVIQLGAYVTPAQADAGWWRVARAYPYLTTLPRIITAVGPTPGRPRYYRVRLAAGSGREARALCRHLHRIGRGCIVV